MDMHNPNSTAEDVPPYSRIFIVCGKGVTEQQITEAFSPFGTIQHTKLLRDRATNEFRGMVYIKYELASSAAIAVENMHGKSVGGCDPMKVVIAESRGANSGQNQQLESPDDLPPRSRLYIVLPKTTTDEELEARFTPFGNLEYARIMREKPDMPGQRGQSKGMAYVKFTSAATALQAMERISQEEEQRMDGDKWRVVLAEPKRKRTANQADLMNPYRGMMGGYDDMMGGRGKGGPISRTRLYVVVPKAVSADTLSRAFSRFPGMEYCDLKMDRATGRSKGFAYVNYSTPQAAAMAMETLNGSEIAPGCTAKIVFAEVKGGGPDAGMGSAAAGMMMGGMNMFPDMPFPDAGHMYDPMQQGYMAAGGMGGMGGLPMMGGLPFGQTGQQPQQAAPAPAQQRMPGLTPPAESHLPEGSRLFVTTTAPLPEIALQDLFSRFPGLEYLRAQRDRPNRVYVKYSTAAAAQAALQYLDGSQYYGQNMKVTIAEPPPAVKRQRL
eukprot:CAMPEP_0177661322 /NCGR_PEP_ID=MMETSP0447-20121125/18607_1 /TAXON_ID=0 /ORGANISM="Stygamoeba regulata, Strain BSH-02190019" /LENGTH=495 /DNA_ID=CAMNT_0019166637 /DNA_START=37 /DNA_END=1524 /DNA_ORIENTATION=+